MNEIKPMRSEGLLREDLGDETLLCSAQNQVIHVLNPSARLIWDLCDGEHSVDQLEAALREAFNVGPEQDVRGDVLRMLEVFAEKGLLS